MDDTGSQSKDINVVIVPESVLQAFEASSHLDLEENEILNFNEFEEKQKTKENVKHVWLDMPMGEFPHVGPTPECSEVTLSKDDVKNSSDETVSLKLFQNCLFINNANTEGVGTSLSASDSTLQGCLNMTVKSVENIGDKNIYTLTPTTMEGMEVGGTKPNDVECQVVPEDLVPGDCEDKLSFALSDETTLGFVNSKNLTASQLCELSYINSDSDDKSKTYKCKFANCKWSFSTPYKLKRHISSHLKQKSFFCDFPGCNKSFMNNYNLKAHLRTHTEVIPELICKTCGVEQPNKRQLEAHERKEHNAAPKLKCPHCPLMFHTQAGVMSHKRVHKPKTQQYPCPLCDKVYTKKFSIKLHMLTHTGEKPYACDRCSWRFANLSRLNRHMASHKEKMLRCTYSNCDKVFYRKDHLYSHMRTHSYNEIKNTNSEIITNLQQNNQQTENEPNLSTIRDNDITPHHTDHLSIGHEVEVDDEINFNAEDDQPPKSDLPSSWTSPLLSSGSLDDNHRNNSEDHLFMEEMSGLAESTSNKLLTLENDICNATTTDNQFVLQPYEIDNESLNLIESDNHHDLTEFRILSTSENEVAPLFKDTLVGSHSTLSRTHFSGTTINLNDLQ
uniref:Zinc finger protein n=1 Tax=Ciona intestinalis TaxID=7719 RepID=Q1RL38_CIOIN|nr:zinc finger protein ZF(C2H2)-151 [Ciona intestinalis]FAA00227.1 TPA: zinc finger protein [Ciona intestinalis]|eukprot:NP_001122369.1 zinc finger protein ZF(C2H2)-151 [Ciona intestinalis]